MTDDSGRFTHTGRFTIHRIRKTGQSAEDALEAAKSKLWWNVELSFYPGIDSRFYVWMADKN